MQDAVTTIMSRDVVTVPPDTYLLELRNLLGQHGIHHVLVVDDGTLVGVISDRDVLKALSPFLGSYTEQHRDVKTLGVRADEIMSHAPITIHDDASVGKAAALLLANNISCLPVLDAEGTVVGILTSRDILKQSSDG